MFSRSGRDIIVGEPLSPSLTKDWEHHERFVQNHISAKMKPPRVPEARKTLDEPATPFPLLCLSLQSVPVPSSQTAYYLV